MWQQAKTSTTAADIAAMYDEARGITEATTQPGQDTVLIVTPAYGGSIDVRYSMAVHAEMRDLMIHNINVGVRQIPCDSLITRGRNRLVHMFLKSRANYMLFWDGDVQPEAAGYVRAMMAELKRGEFAVLGGAYPVRSDATPRRVVCNLLPSAIQDGEQLPIENGVAEVRHIGTGFMLYHRSLIYRLMAAHMDLCYPSNSTDDAGEPLWALFDAQLRDGEYLSEDWLFCDRVRKLGERVGCLVDAKFVHWGPYGFRGSFLDWFAGGEA
jgi:hypothetical protein